MIVVMRTLSTEEAKAMRSVSKGRIGHIDPAKAATEHPTLRDITWAAGIFEGEGCAAKNGIRSGEFVGVTQKERWLCDRMRALFGGTVKVTKRKEAWRGDGKVSEYWHWSLSGARARGFMMTIYTFLSPRRKEQIKWVLGKQTKEQYLAANYS
jgi:hypothetical protein